MPTRQELISRSAKLAYPIRDGIPIMLPEEARPADGLTPPAAASVSWLAGGPGAGPGPCPFSHERRTDEGCVLWGEFAHLPPPLFIQ